jgi:hypothetical protein
MFIQPKFITLRTDQLLVYTGSFREQDGVDGIATCYGLSSSRFKPWWKEEIFSSPHPSRLTLGPNQPPVLWLLGHFPSGVQGPGSGADHPPPSSAAIKNE